MGCTQYLVEGVGFMGDKGVGWVFESELETPALLASVAEWDDLSQEP